MTVDLVKGLMREIGPLLNLDAVDEMNDAPHWRLAFDELYGMDAVLDEERGLLVLIASVPAPEHLDKEALYRKTLTHNHGWPASGRARAGLRGDAIVLTEEITTEGLDLSRLSGSVTALTTALKAFMADLPSSDADLTDIAQNYTRV